ncbi:MAG: dual specificity protein phosphatase family protein [Candidatus Thermoplasmatota archaeon]|nr:dual specificity protein phosphatase family protein [Euryarchaeota archaeon]MBU4144046.1 dual specificity protein phosphatase family protein [Candidatus Thermoplasmatota archaeon]MBU4591840.1 dual specificity protein phosphatase family protein [Candidatus Thermoplasmatota archaeon]
MIEIHPKLFIGNQDDYENIVRVQPDWHVVHACKEPYHRRALGYTGRGAPKGHPEYLIAPRGNSLILNLVDADTPAYIPKEIIDAALDFVKTALNNGHRVLVHCNQGMSRSAGIGLLFLAAYTNRFNGMTFPQAEQSYRTIYPLFNPGLGMRRFIEINWNVYLGRNAGELAE